MTEFLLKLLRSAPPPGTTTLEALVRNRALQQELSLLIMSAAEERYPGIEKIANDLVRQERALQGEEPSA